MMYYASWDYRLHGVASGISLGDRFCIEIWPWTLELDALQGEETIFYVHLKQSGPS